ncbi:hypothetical protein HYX10_01395 [Candidatus Woesearchaeota archaeon]|nr:hypothetical protein [Candidatus Woesearchaeota archaeon]
MDYELFYHTALIRVAADNPDISGNALEIVTHQEVNNVAMRAISYFICHYEPQPGEKALEHRIVTGFLELSRISREKILQISNVKTTTG